MATATSAIELFSQLLHENEINKPFFEFAKKFLIWLDETENAPRKIFPYVQIRLTQLMGLGIRLELNDSQIDSSYYLDIESGLVSESSGTGSNTFKLTQNQISYVSQTLKGKGSRVFEIDFNRGELKELVRLLDRYLKYHVEGLRDRKSDAIFEQILQD
jgi:recombinational DNA repair protein (RecF pathway)